MKKILASLAIIFSLTFTIIGIGGCISCKPSNEENGGQPEVETITTLEGVWESEHGRTGEHEKVFVEGASIKCYINRGANHNDELRWAGIYIPFKGSISEGQWTFENDELCDEERPDYSSKLFQYSNEKLSCYMDRALGGFETIYFTKVPD